VSGDAGAQELLELNFSLNMVGETIVGPIFPTSTGFLGVTLFVDGTQTNNDANSSSLVVSRLDVGSSFAGGGDTQTCNVRLTKPLGSTGSESTSGGCLDIVPVSFISPNDFVFVQALGLQAFGDASADFLGTAAIVRLELFDANMNSLGPFTLSDSGVTIPGGGASVPEPATLALCFLGFVALSLFRVIWTRGASAAQRGRARDCARVRRSS
jgi:hypothetical protein